MRCHSLELERMEKPRFCFPTNFTNIRHKKIDIACPIRKKHGKLSSEGTNT